MKSDWAYASPKKGEGKRKGAANLEFVLSFVIFVVFLVFLYNVLDPIIKTAGSKQFILGHLKLALLENLTLSDFTIQTFTLNLTNTDLGSKGCIKLAGSNGGKVYDIAKDNPNLVIKTLDGETINYSFSGEGGGSFQVGPLESNTDTILKIYFASEFTNKSPELQDTGCTPVDKDDYSIESIIEKEIISSSNVYTIQDAYFENYGLLKDILGVPFGNEFTIGFQVVGLRLEDGDIIWPKNSLEPPLDVNVYVGEFPIQYIDEEANIKIGFLIVKVW